MTYTAYQWVNTVQLCCKVKGQSKSIIWCTVSMTRIVNVPLCFQYSAAGIIHKLDTDTWNVHWVTTISTTATYKQIKLWVKQSTMNHIMIILIAFLFVSTYAVVVLEVDHNIKDSHWAVYEITMNLLSVLALLQWIIIHRCIIIQSSGPGMQWYQSLNNYCTSYSVVTY